MDERFDITKGVDSTVWQAIEKSIENNSKETFHSLRTFVRRIISLSVNQRSLRHFNSYISFPSFYYSVSFQRFQENAALHRLHKICAEFSVIDLRESIWLMGIENRQLRDLEATRVLNTFYYSAFKALSMLLYFAVSNKDLKQFEFAIGEFEDLTDGIDRNNYELDFNIRSLSRETGSTQNAEELVRLRLEKEVYNQFNTYKRHSLMGIKYWILFLNQVNVFTPELTLNFLKNIVVSQGSSDDFLSDIIFFSNQTSFEYMGWGGWDYKDRQFWKLYSPPNPPDWLMLGFMADQIRGNSLYINLDELDSDKLEKIRFLSDVLRQKAYTFESGIEKWGDVLGITSLDDLRTKSEPIIAAFEAAKKRTTDARENAIATSSLSQTRIEQFRQAVGRAWKSQARMHQLFGVIGNTLLVTDENTKLKVVGQKTFFEKAKMMFIDGDNYSPIYGVEQMGGEVGRWEDNEFFNTIMTRDCNRTSGSSILDTIEKCFSELRLKDILPTVILISPEYTYKDPKFTNDKRWVNKAEFVQGELPFFALGKFDGIPVYSSFSPFLTNNVVVSNFESAFRMRYKTNPDWFEQKLLVNVSEVGNSEAGRRLEKDEEKWRKGENGQITRDDALTLIKTSVFIDIWTIIDFQIQSKDGYVIGFIKAESKAS
jgi:hypothetical protein